MKLILLALLICIPGCTTLAKGPPFADISGGAAYATIISPDDKKIEVWVSMVDERATARNIIGEGVAMDGDIYVTPGMHSLNINCMYFGAGKYNNSLITMTFEPKKTYTFTCSSDPANTEAIYIVIDESGNVVPFTISSIPRK
jgi:hypothetical protein